MLDLENDKHSIELMPGGNDGPGKGGDGEQQNPPVESPPKEPSEEEEKDGK